MSTSIQLAQQAWIIDGSIETDLDPITSVVQKSHYSSAVRYAALRLVVPGGSQHLLDHNRLGLDMTLGIRL